MDFNNIKEKLSDGRSHAMQCIKYIKERNCKTIEELHQQIYSYVLYKYNLFGEVKDVFKLDDLAQMSVAKAIKLSKEQAIEFDNNGSCEGTTSAMNKKVLLLMAIQKELSIKFPMEKTAYITTTKELASAVWQELD